MAALPTKQVLGLTDITLMTITANFGIRWLAVAATLGFAAIGYWVIGAILFFIPLAFMSAHLSKRYPEEGGMYAWTRHVLGEKAGFMVAWLYWINNVFYYSAILIFLSTNFAYFLGDPGLINNTWYLNISVLCAFWLIVIIGLYGLNWVRHVVKYGGLFGLIIPAAVLIGFGFFALIKFGHSATPWSWQHLLPEHHAIASLSHLTMIMFAMAGIEVIPTFANSVKNAKRNLYLGLLLGAIGILVLYILGTMAMNILLSPTQIQETSGLMHSFAAIGMKFHLPWFSQTFAFLLTFAELAALAVWLLAPITMFFKCTPAGVLPEVLHKTDKNGTPRNAILFMGVLVTAIVLLTNSLPGVNVMYQALVLMATILYFIPYLFLAVIYAKSHAHLPLPKYAVFALSAGVLVSITLGILFSFAPPSGVTSLHGIIVYELNLVFGPLIFLLIGYGLYRRYEKQKLSHNAH